jgi:hypothetical protein
MELGILTPSFARFLQYILLGSYRFGNPTMMMEYPISYEKYLTDIILPKNWTGE